jgi:large conductance mechanosensitive channel
MVFYALYEIEFSQQELDLRRAITNHNRGGVMSVWNNPNVQRVEKGVGGTLSGFKAFILRGNVVDLAVGIVIGAAFTSVVNAFVSDIITPLIPVGSTGLSTGYITLPVTHAKWLYGAFINSVISFLIIAFIVYFFVVRPVNGLMSLYKKGQPEAVTTKECPYCISNVPLQATRCPYCTSALPPLQQPPAPAQRPQ